MAESRISPIRSKFAGQIRVLDNLQLSDGSAPGTKKWQDFKWESVDSEFVTQTREKSDLLMDIINSPRNCTPDTREQMEIVIDTFMDYDHGKITPHRLLDKIAMYGSVTDCDKLNIKRGTVLAQAPTQDGEPVIAKMLKPMVALKKNGVGEHLLLVTNSDAGSSRALPDGIRAARVFCFVGTEAPNNFKQYTSVGNAKRGLFLNKFTEALPATDKTYYAWYIAVYEDTKGNMLDLSEPLRVEIFISKG